MPNGAVSSSSEYCKSIMDFQNGLSGKTAKAIKISAGSTERACNDAYVANQIVTAFSSCTSSSCPRKSFSCQGYSWRVGQCASGGEITVGRGNICACNSNDVTIRPCIGNKNWGGSGTVCNSTSLTLRVEVYLLGNVNQTTNN